ncbi:conserved hypothetical protein [Paraglaciecola sp. T6c]|uniref:hypothetical protein n=1 Tax=Pseudoalteromonas atlantica (strain T6c / ATCC BAA-1087) TaxID=3042615 RepID=UPI00005C6D57|nr:hypothetical protein [Paraglaciecola sp. T6c]ABG40546.1 conserved hypothetical protein [Paraglaciecola sp. T6c]
MFSVRVASYLLISLILFQSFSAVANSLDFHSIDSQHLSEIHEHQAGDNTVSAKTLVQQQSNEQSNADKITVDISHNPADCHHCGHCHGTHAHWLGNSNGIELESVTTHHGFYYLTKIIEGPVTQLLRPPKA